MDQQTNERWKESKERRKCDLVLFVIKYFLISTQGNTTQHNTAQKGNTLHETHKQTSKVSKLSNIGYCNPIIQLLVNS